MYFHNLKDEIYLFGKQFTYIEPESIGMSRARPNCLGEYVACDRQAKVIVNTDNIIYMLVSEKTYDLRFKDFISESNKHYEIKTDRPEYIINNDLLEEELNYEFIKEL